ncbi:MAG: DUF4124 domain-containing protein [Burkholderiales bacterium]|nr:DUF4124 domain-containing protein [Burkholderiales bacterium]
MRRLALFSALALAPLAAGAQVSYRCVGADGKKYYGQTIPSQCVGQPVEQLGPDGRVQKRIAPAPAGGAPAARPPQTEEEKKREAMLKEQARRDRALLATYTSEADIEAARRRALADNEQAVKETEGRLAALKKRQGELLKEMEFYQGKNKPPAKLEQELRDTQFSLETQAKLLEQKRREVDAINARYDDDRRRFLELTRGAKK